MKHCENCNIKINTNKKQCPICFNELEGTFDKNLPQSFSEKVDKNQSALGNFFLMRLFGFMSIVIIATCGFINYMTDPNILWSAVVSIGVVYVWVLIKHTILSKRGGFEKIFFQFVSLLAIVLSTNWVSSDNSWIWQYFVPAASLTTITVLVLILIVNKKRSDFVLSSFVMNLLLIALSLTLMLTNLDTFMILNMINLIYGGLFMLSILLFGFKSLKRGLQKTLHL